MKDYQGRYWRSTPEVKAKIAAITRQVLEENDLSVRAFGGAIHATGEAVNQWKRGVSVPNLYVYLFAAEAGGIYARWAAMCLEASGFVPLVLSLAVAVSDYKDSKESDE